MSAFDQFDSKAAGGAAGTVDNALASLGAETSSKQHKGHKTGDDRQGIGAGGNGEMQGNCYSRILLVHWMKNGFFLQYFSRIFASGVNSRSLHVFWRNLKRKNSSSFSSMPTRSGGIECHRRARDIPDCEVNFPLIQHNVSADSTQKLKSKIASAQLSEVKLTGIQKNISPFP